MKEVWFIVGIIFIQEYIVINLYYERLQLREILEKDWKFILELRNQNYKNSFLKQQEPIEINEHNEYMNKQKLNSKFHQWLAIYDTEDVGYVRILDDDVNIIVKKSFQKKGFGTIMLNLLEIKAKELGIKKLKAKVLVTNKNSKKIFEKNNYEFKTYYFEKDVF